MLFGSSNIKKQAETMEIGKGLHLLIKIIQTGWSYIPRAFTSLFWDLCMFWLSLFFWDKPSSLLARLYSVDSQEALFCVCACLFVLILFFPFPEQLLCLELLELIALIPFDGSVCWMYLWIKMFLKLLWHPYLSLDSSVHTYIQQTELGIFMTFIHIYITWHF